MSEPMRIQRALARAGIASRRRAEELVAAGRVRVNGVPARVGQSVDPAADTITVDGTAIGAPPAPVWLVLNKPLGVLTSRRDEGRGRRTVFDLVPDVPGLTYVGRLDYLTEGVLLLTNDGDAAHRLTHPSREVERVYVATVRGDGAGAVRAARHGVMLDDGPVELRAIQARSLGRGLWDLELVIAEGRTREIRRVCDALGLEVERLLRTRFGPITLGDLVEGAHRPLARRERRALAALTAMEQATDAHGRRPRT